MALLLFELPRREEKKGDQINGREKSCPAPIVYTAISRETLGGGQQGESHPSITGGHTS